jgi:hypothetical protein
MPIFIGDGGRLGGTGCPGPLLEVEGGIGVIDRCSGGAVALRPAPLP